MNKKEFFTLIEDFMPTSSVELKVKFLKKIRDIWIPELIAKETKNYTFCPNCKKYVSKTSYEKIVERKTLKNECIHTDSGWGENDMFGDVTYLITYEVCPKCKNKTLLSKVHLKTEDTYHH